jgi:hypothetical protein
MEIGELQKRMLEAYAIRVEPEMARYALARLAAAGNALRELPIIGGHAKTGLPMRTVIDPAALRAPATPS